MMNNPSESEKKLLDNYILEMYHDLYESDHKESYIEKLEDSFKDDASKEINWLTFSALKKIKNENASLPIFDWNNPFGKK